MINSPIAQLGRRVMIHRLDDDPQGAWEAVMEKLAETDGLNMTFNDDGTVTLEGGRREDEEEVVIADQEHEPQEEAAAPF